MSDEPQEQQPLRSTKDLSDDEVREIRTLGASGRMQYADIGRKYRISKTAASQIARRRVRKAVT